MKSHTNYIKSVFCGAVLSWVHQPEICTLHIKNASINQSIEEVSTHATALNELSASSIALHSLEAMMWGWGEGTKWRTILP